MSRELLAQARASLPPTAKHVHPLLGPQDFYQSAMAEFYGTPENFKRWCEERDALRRAEAAAEIVAARLGQTQEQDAT